MKLELQRYAFLNLMVLNTKNVLTTNFLRNIYMEQNNPRPFPQTATPPVVGRHKNGQGKNWPQNMFGSQKYGEKVSLFPKGILQADEMQTSGTN
jgi:hypothetical protein